MSIEKTVESGKTAGENVEASSKREALSMKVFAMKVEGRMEHEELEENLKKY